MRADAPDGLLHWCLDASRIRQGHAAENFSRLRQLALNLLRQEKTLKIGLIGKANACSWDHQCLMPIPMQ